MSLSRYQEAIIAAAGNSDSGNVIVNAVAGSGKTTTLMMAAESHPLRRGLAVFAAFNKAIAEHIGKKLSHGGSGMVAKTIHSLGYSELRSVLGGKIRIANKKYEALAEKLFVGVKTLAPLVHLSTLARLTLCEITPHALWELSERHSIVNPGIFPDEGEEKADAKEEEDAEEKEGDKEKADAKEEERNYWEVAAEVVGELIGRGDEMARNEGVIDFCDMLYLPVQWKIVRPQIDWLLIDECQDLSPVQIELLLRMARGRVMAVGDPHQAIYGFAGAAADSFDRVRESFSAYDLPLSICYRCPISHIALAQAIVPQIEAAPGAIDGLVEEIDTARLMNIAEPNDLVICRKTAPLVGLFFRFVKRRKPVRLLGKDIGARIITTVAKIAGWYKGFEYGRFLFFLEKYFRRRIETQRKKGNCSAVESLIDQREAISGLYTGLNAPSFAEFCSGIEKIFTDVVGNYTTLSTVHRIKGGEADRVFILGPQDLPLVWKNQQPWQFEQEINLRYVALTRAKRELYFVGGCAQMEYHPESMEDEDWD